jgi:hypothetical protein
MAYKDKERIDFGFVFWELVMQKLFGHETEAVNERKKMVQKQMVIGRFMQSNSVKKSIHQINFVDIIYEFCF